MDKTTVYTNIGQRVIGYVINTRLSEQNQKKVEELQNKLVSRFGDAIWPVPLKSLHITLMDWIAPLVEYTEDRDRLFNKKFPTYDKNLRKLLSEVGQIHIGFKNIVASREAIIAVGTDNGEFSQIRGRFIKEVELLPNTKQPPVIIHFTFARFLKEVDLREIQKFLRDQKLETMQTVSSFRLVKETKTPMLEYGVLKEYKLS